MAWHPDYRTLAEVKAFLRITDTDDDAALSLAITAASRAIDDRCNRQFGLVGSSEARQYSACWSRRYRRWVVEFDDLSSATGLTVTVPAGTVDAYVLRPVNALKLGRVYTELHVKPEAVAKPTGRDPDEVTMTTDKWGWPAFPGTVKQATDLQVSRWHARRDAPFGVAGSPDIGSEIRLLAKLDPDVEVMLRGFYRWWGAR